MTTNALHKALCKGLALVGLLALGACTSPGSSEDAGYWGDILAAGQAGFQLRGAPPPQAPPLTRALLVGFDQPLVRITNLDASSSATLVPVASSGSAANRLITWRGVGTTTFTTRGDLLVATRGAGPDLMSSDLRGLSRALGAGGGRYARSHVILVGNTEGLTLQFDCTLRAAGRETVSIVERSVETTRFVEDCVGPPGTFRNDYWRDGRDGTLWQSRQWAGPQLGHLLIERVIK